MDRTLYKFQFVAWRRKQSPVMDLCIVECVAV